MVLRFHFLPPGGKGGAIQASVSLLAKLLALTATFFSPEPANRKGHGRLLIEAGERGWSEPAPGLLEIEQSAAEYLCPSDVFRLVLPTGSKSYVRTVFRRVAEVRPTHYFYDTRTGSQNPFRGSVEAIIVAAILAWFRSIPITILTNFPARRWRRQVSAVTALNGLILVLLQPDNARGWLAHGRVYGPIFMPFSRKRLKEIREKFPRSPRGRRWRSVAFVGTTYEPRKTRLDNIGKSLGELGIELIRYERLPHDPKISQEDYWRFLRQAPVTITTADHIMKMGADTGFPPHMVYRYTEALVAESCLIAPDLGGPLEPWVHFVPFGDDEDLRAVVTRLFGTPRLAEEIMHNGSALISRRIDDQSWWREIDEALIGFGQRPLKDYRTQ